MAQDPQRVRRGPPSTVRWILSGGATFNSLLRSGETIYLRASTHPEANGPGGIFGSFDDDPRFRSLTAGFIPPVGINGLTFNAEGVVTQTTPAPVGGFLQMSSMFEKFSARWSYPLDRSRKLSTGTVSELQTRLSALGYYTGSIDGELGPGTLSALRKYRFGGLDVPPG